MLVKVLTLNALREERKYQQLKLNLNTGQLVVRFVCNFLSVCSNHAVLATILSLYARMHALNPPYFTEQ